MFQSSNPQDCHVKNCNFSDDMAKIGISYQIVQITGLIFTKFSQSADIMRRDD